jgi:hypothetical protein
VGANTCKASGISQYMYAQSLDQRIALTSTSYLCADEKHVALVVCVPACLKGSLAPTSTTHPSWVTPQLCVSPWPPPLVPISLLSRRISLVLVAHGAASQPRLFPLVMDLPPMVRDYIVLPTGRATNLISYHFTNQCCIIIQSFCIFKNITALYSPYMHVHTYPHPVFGLETCNHYCYGFYCYYMHPQPTAR